MPKREYSEVLVGSRLDDADEHLGPPQPKLSVTSVEEPQLHDIPRLLRLIHAQRCLWDTRAENFGDAVQTELAWSFIATAINMAVCDVRCLWNSVWSACAFRTRQRPFRQDLNHLQVPPNFVVSGAQPSTSNGIAENWEQLVANARQITAEEEEEIDVVDGASPPPSSLLGVAAPSPDSVLAEGLEIPPASPPPTTIPRSSSISCPSVISAASSPREGTVASPKKPKKSVRWSPTHEVRLNEETFTLPRRFTSLQLLKAGPSSSVCSAADLVTFENVAIRRMALEQTADELGDIYRSIVLARLIPHENLLCPRDAFVYGGHVYTCWELLDGCVSEVLEEPLNHFTVAKIVHQLLRAIAHLHRHGLVHMDIRPSTIGINTDATLRILNYGSRKAVAKTTELQRPETDIWSIGCIMAQFLLTREDSKQEKKEEEKNENVEMSEVKDEKEKQDTTTEELKKLRCRRLPEDTEKGLTSVNALSLLDLLMRQKLTAEQALEHPYLHEFAQKEKKYVGNDNIDTLEEEIRKKIEDEKNTEQWRELIMEEVRRFAPIDVDVDDEERGHHRK